MYRRLTIDVCIVCASTGDYGRITRIVTQKLLFSIYRRSGWEHQVVSVLNKGRTGIVSARRDGGYYCMLRSIEIQDKYERKM